MEKKHTDVDSVMNSYTQAQLRYEELNARDQEQYEIKHTLAQIHRLLYVLVDKIDKLK